MVKKIVRLRIALLIFILLTLFGALYYYSSESKQPFIGHPKKLNQILLDQEIENAALLFRIDSLLRINESLKIETHLVDGIFFEVQIAAFDNFTIDKLDGNLKRLNYSTIDGVNYITLGKFRDVDVAKIYIEDLKKIGIREAFIVSKLDGKTITTRQ